ncbi:MAG: hypothetical protein EPO20_27600 [Betaproteobacteria bacterium]|nr:MAG: hypothetical protein EPO20_27600 [Betaproteobacteria bacterium]
MSTGRTSLRAPDTRATLKIGRSAKKTYHGSVRSQRVAGRELDRLDEAVAFDLQLDALHVRRAIARQELEAQRCGGREVVPFPGLILREGGAA